MVAVGPLPPYADEDTLEDALICFSAADQWATSHKIPCHTLPELYGGGLLSLPSILLVNCSALARKSMWNQTMPQSSNNHTCQQQIAFKMLVTRSFYRR